MTNQGDRSRHISIRHSTAAKTVVALGLAESVSALTGTALHAELRRLAFRAVLDAHYDQRPDDRPHIAEVALFLAKARKLPFAGRADLSSVLRALADAMGSDVDPETLLAATVRHLATGGSAA